jgi:hypothetical protein
VLGLGCNLEYMKNKTKEEDLGIEYPFSEYVFDHFCDEFYISPSREVEVLHTTINGKGNVARIKK